MSKKKVPNSYVEIGEFKSIVLKQASILSREITFRCQYPDNYKELISYSFPDNFSWSQRLYHYINDDMEFDLGKWQIIGKITDKDLGFNYIDQEPDGCRYNARIIFKRADNKICLVHSDKNNYYQEFQLNFEIY